LKSAYVVTHRRSIAERGGCFQRRLFVCQFVSQHDNFRTIRRTMMKLGDWVHCTKISPISNFGVKGQRSRLPGTKNEKVRHFSGAVLTKTSQVRVVSSASSIRRWENQIILSFCLVPLWLWLCRFFSIVKHQKLSQCGQLYDTFPQFFLAIL